MRYLSIDYGSKRIGIAVSDDEGRMAFPAGFIPNRGKAVIREIADRIRKEHADLIVVGMPMGLDGKETEQTYATRLFVAALQNAIHLSIETENEMLTSRMAERSGMKDGHIDAASAALILQSYLDKENAKLKNQNGK